MRNQMDYIQLKKQIEESQRFGGKVNIPASKETKKYIENATRSQILINVPSALHPSARFLVIKNPNASRSQDKVLMAITSDPKRRPMKMFSFFGTHVSHQKAMDFAKKHKLVAMKDKDGNPLYAKESVEQLDEVAYVKVKRGKYKGMTGIVYSSNGYENATYLVSGNKLAGDGKPKIISSDNLENAKGSDRKTLIKIHADGKNKIPGHVQAKRQMKDLMKESVEGGDLSDIIGNAILKSKKIKKGAKESDIISAINNELRNKKPKLSRNAIAFWMRDRDFLADTLGVVKRGLKESVELDEVKISRNPQLKLGLGKGRPAGQLSWQQKQLRIINFINAVEKNKKSWKSKVTPQGMRAERGDWTVVVGDPERGHPDIVTYNNKNMPWKPKGGKLPFDKFMKLLDVWKKEYNRMKESVELDEVKRDDPHFLKSGRFHKEVHAELKKVMDSKYYREFRASNGGRALDNVINHMGKSRGYRVDKTVKSIIAKYGKNRDEFVKLSFQSAAKGRMNETLDPETAKKMGIEMPLKDKKYPYQEMSGPDIVDTKKSYKDMKKKLDVKKTGTEGY